VFDDARAHLIEGIRQAAAHDFGPDAHHQIRRARDVNEEAGHDAAFAVGIHSVGIVAPVTTGLIERLPRALQKPVIEMTGCVL
jgi:hypothetical protein